MVQGRYADARKSYEDGLEIANELDDLRGQGVALGQLGTLAMLEGNLKEAAERYNAALTLFQQLGEPASEATLWHQLGIVFQEASAWDDAEKCYREAARIKEELGMISGPNGAAGTWGQLAILSGSAGKPEAAEMWYRKAIHGFRGADDQVNLSKTLHNLAGLLMNLPGRLTEARQLAEEALAIDKTLDPGAAAIWKTYGILAEIARKGGSLGYRRPNRGATANAGKRISTACTRRETQFRRHAA